MMEDLQQIVETGEVLLVVGRFHLWHWVAVYRHPLNLVRDWLSVGGLFLVAQV
jgi:hypothetical protein